VQFGNAVQTVGLFSLKKNKKRERKVERGTKRFNILAHKKKFEQRGSLVDFELGRERRRSYEV
jgi:hypothetical protein